MFSLQAYYLTIVYEIRTIGSIFSIHHLLTHLPLNIGVRQMDIYPYWWALLGVYFLCYFMPNKTFKIAHETKPERIAFTVSYAKQMTDK